MTALALVAPIALISLSVAGVLAVALDLATSPKERPSR